MRPVFLNDMWLKNKNRKTRRHPFTVCFLHKMTKVREERAKTLAQPPPVKKGAVEAVEAGGELPKWDAV
jgi:hypothetical protein